MKNNRNRLFSNGLFYIVVFLLLLWGINWVLGGSSNSGATETISYSEFVKKLRNGEIKDFNVQPSNGVYSVTGSYKSSQTKSSSSSDIFGGNTSSKVTGFSTTMLENDPSVKKVQDLAQSENVKMSTQGESSNWISTIIMLVPTVLSIVFMVMMMNQGGSRGQGGGIMNFGRSNVKPQDPKKNKVRFDDVAGEEEEKQELVEVVEFLKNPARYTKLGARIPSGVLLEGPPGTGKTLLAKAVAGEAGVPFFYISGSDFVEMFVGVGASRVRDLFTNAKKNAPSIIFIDEIDAIGRKRGNGQGGSNDEREQTLNQMLVEMDGFEGDEGVIVMAATNRSDVLDPALTRPGRFDRKVLVGPPDVKGREAILRVHAKNKPLADDVDLKEVARQTPGFVGADLENVLNEAALVAARRNGTKITAADIDEAEDRVIAGPAKKDRMISKKERERVAFHEAGHSICGLVLSDSRTVRKVTIVPRGRAGGYNIMLPKDDQFILTKKQLFEQIVGLMGGRAGEEVVVGDQSTGASNDFEQATTIARSMVVNYGMTDELGMVELEKEGEGTPYGFKPYSEATAAKIDEAVKKILDEAHAKAVEIVENNREKHRIIAEALLKYETLDEKQIYSLYKTGKMPEKSSEEFPSEAKALSYEEAKEAAQKRAEEKAEEDTAEKQALATPSEDAVKPETDAAKLAEPDASASQEDPVDSLPTPSESDLSKDPEKDDNDAPSQKTEQTDDSDKDE
ncbi:ATP-dependent zinc metalloprotease FtsH [Lactobacillus delbrueckii subsp. bulgaricus]|uniref:ATP-dependent zinc metalloprotease FtsH n=1 Tax=Lactobacillus delbrueckii TaxID=1584 RepID=UPI001C1E88B6|nr:ATP-dependent zinc metalloprotease FtsH [Lactobacillus delbrueckii]MBU6049357.1 ATP-dependent zinc metalloprotease FtsH [Lactobacillus delbrueckii]MCD5461264.1 ATP-dependent zinc metalloprotease FtsH [Lactobacillus delbrueckii subsp. bulgaricus]MCD5476748.1 ATP-dependent zinc metalloprotease FtsH [Lactobacillus delbrueckii subsp. bulgaricus]MCT3477440.1 ATP-dependent zinc metalloprotease FtsH [Lactobacillus delbrueckii subsp. bulgaricus]MCT3479769.1 ATP-dependent zinc metalloprotease FtsH [